METKVHYEGPQCVVALICSLSNKKADLLGDEAKLYGGSGS
jgi:hypothetical protein